MNYFQRNSIAMIAAVTIAKFTSSVTTKLRNTIAKVVAASTRMKLRVVSETLGAKITITVFTDTVRYHAISATCRQYGEHLLIDAPESFLIQKLHSIYSLAAAVAGKGFITFR